MFDSLPVHRTGFRAPAASLTLAHVNPRAWRAPFRVLCALLSLSQADRRERRKAKKAQNMAPAADSGAAVDPETAAMMEAMGMPMGFGSSKC